MRDWTTPGRRARGRSGRASCAPRAWMLRALAAGCLLGPATSASAQSVVVRVTDAGTGEPMQGVLLTLRDAGGALAGSALTDARGRFLFTGLTPGAHDLVAEVIGYASERREGIAVPEGETALIELALSARAIELEGIRVEGEERCSVRPEEGLRVAAVWDEARKALEAARFTDELAVYQYRMRRHMREVDERSGRTVRQTSERTTLYGRTPFESRPAEDLLENGFVQDAHDGEGGQLYFAPDAAVLLSDAFLDTHCLRLREGRGDEEGLVGLDFQPIRGRRVPDIRGTLWLRADGWELSHLEYGYENLRVGTGLRGIGGRVAFRRLPAGTWIIPDWWIRMPWMAESRDLRGRPQVHQAGYREEGGTVLWVREPGVGLILSASAATLEGVVLEEIASEPVAGVEVTLRGTEERVTTDAEGRFRFSDLVPGRYDVGFHHPSMDAYGYLPDPVERQVEAGDVVFLRWRMPSPTSLRERACPEDIDSRPVGSTILAGRVTRAGSEEGFAGAEVTIEWDEIRLDAWNRYVFAAKVSGQGVQTTTDAEGRYRACVVPTDTRLTIRARVGEVETEPDTLRIRPGVPALRHDVVVRPVPSGS